MEKELVVPNDQGGMGWAVFLGGLEEAGEAFLEMKEDGFGVLAGAETVGGEIGGGGVKEALGEVDDLDLIRAVGIG